MQDLSQQDYINRIEQLKNELKMAWDQDLRVRALKIVIQVRVETPLWPFGLPPGFQPTARE
jgi:hypothetical protein